MEVIDFGKVAEEAKKKDPNVNGGKLFANICLDGVIQRSTYRGGRALTESEVPKGLKEAICKYFATHIRKDYCRPFELARLERSNVEKSVICVVPEGVYEELHLDDGQFDEGLREVGKRFGVEVDLPWYCYAK